MDRDMIKMLFDASVLSSADLKIKYLTALKYVVNYSPIVTHCATGLLVTVKSPRDRGPDLLKPCKRHIAPIAIP
jgi:hypothetical protein